MGNANTTPKKKPAAKKTPARKSPGKKQPRIPRGASAAPKPMAKARWHVYQGPDGTCVAYELDPATGRYDLNPRPVVCPGE